MAARPDSVAQWTVAHVDSWLDDIGLRDWGQRLRFHGVDGSLLLELDRNDLTDPPYRLTPQDVETLLRELLRITPVAEWRFFHVDFWLDDIGLTAEKRQRFLDYRVDGSLLLDLDKEDLTGTTLGLTEVGAKKLLNKLEPIRPCREEKRKVIREMIVHENTLYSLRATNFVVLQGFLFTAAAVLMQSKSWLVLLIAVAGLFLACATGESMGSNFKAIRRLMGKVYPGAREPKHDDGLPVIGFDSPDEKKTDRCCTRRKIMPLVFMLCWGTWILFFFGSKIRGEVGK